MGSKCLGDLEWIKMHRTENKWCVVTTDKCIYIGSSGCSGIWTIAVAHWVTVPRHTLRVFCPCLILDVLLNVCRPKEQSHHTPLLFFPTPVECICCSAMTVSISGFDCLFDGEVYLQDMFQEYGHFSKTGVLQYWDISLSPPPPHTHVHQPTQ